MSFFLNEAFLVAKSALGPHGANPPHIHMHMRKIGQLFKIGVFVMVPTRPLDSMHMGGDSAEE